MLSPMFLFMFKLINKNKAARKSHEKTKRIAFKIAFFLYFVKQSRGNHG